MLAVVVLDLGSRMMGRGFLIKWVLFFSSIFGGFWGALVLGCGRLREDLRDMRRAPLFCPVFAPEVESFEPGETERPWGDAYCYFSLAHF